MLDLSLKFESNLKYIQQPQISLEAMFMKLSMMESSIDITQVLSGNIPQNIPINKPVKISESIINKTDAPDNINTYPEKETSVDTSNSSDKSESIKSHIKQSLTLEIIEQSWKNVISEIEKNNSKIAHFLEDATLNKLDGSQLYIELLHGHRFHQTTLEKDIEQIEIIMNRVLNENIQIKFFMKENKGIEAEQKKSENAEHPLFEKALETFDGEIIR